MPRIRTIKPAFFKNEQLADLQPIVRLLFIGLWTLCDAEGKMEDRPKRIKAELFPYDDIDVELSLDQLEEKELIVRYETDGQKCICVLRFKEHQRITGSEATTDSILPDVPIEWNKKSFQVVSLETLRTTGKEGKGKEGKGRERIADAANVSSPKPTSSKKILPHLFRDSEFFEKIKIAAALFGTQYQDANVDYYHESALNWSDNKTAKKTNWLATLKNWMLRDMTEGKFITNNFKPPVNGQGKTNSDSGIRQSVNQKFAERYGESR